MWDPKYILTPQIVTFLMQIEASKQAIADLPITSRVLASLRETARLASTHYSTMIEGNRLTQEEVEEVVQKAQHFPGRARDEQEVLGYYAALEELEELARSTEKITEQQIQHLHALVMAGGKKKVSPTPYRDGQNVIRDSQTRGIVYMPPEAKDVPLLMRELFVWIDQMRAEKLPCPLLAAIAHYQYATIHPYYDGNGRTARLLTTLILHQGGYDLKGIYSLEEYYAKNLPGYYEALTVGPSHNYYMGRAEADITSWIAYFCSGMAVSFENVKRAASTAASKGEKEKAFALKSLDPRQRIALTLFEKKPQITTADLEPLLQLKPRTARLLCQKWVESGFLIIADPSKKNRKYRLRN